MAMANLGSPADIWRWPFHYFMAVRNEYLKIMGMTPPDEKPKGEMVAPGVYLERFDL